MREYNYEYADCVMALVAKEVVRAFSSLKSQLFIDEINVISRVNAVYRDLGQMVRRAYRKIARYYYGIIWDDEVRESPDYLLDEEWIEAILEGYDPLSHYVFTHEEDRKRALLIEAIMASQNPKEEIDAAAKRLGFMYNIYSVRVADEAAVKAFLDQGVRRVQWIAELDNRTCKVCYTRDGKIYPMSELPPKPHINCRCTLRRIDTNAEIDYAAIRNG